MKNRKRMILLTAVCASLLAITGFGTLAYFTAQDAAENKFMIANSDDDPDDIFAITVTEEVTGEDIEKNPDGPGYIYKNVIPGDTLPKNPTVTNTGKYDQWVRVRVTLTNVEAWEAAKNDPDVKHKLELADGNILYTITDVMLGIDGIDQSAIPGWIPEDDKNQMTSDWIYGGESLGNNETTWTFYLNRRLKPTETARLFDRIHIPGSLTTAQMKKLSQFDLRVTADAIQADNTGESAKATFENTAYWND